MTPQALMFQGTASHVGKSVLTAALCRLLKRRGIRVAPFKAVNMSNNAWVTERGEEMAVAQAAQARACGLAPEVEMNPVLLKTTADHSSQVILRGRPLREATASEFPGLRDRLAPVIEDSFRALSQRYEFIVVEGAGSPAEVNLKAWDLANMFVARTFRLPVILIGDIERGGLFAQMIGTLALLAPGDRRLIRGFLINKFRGQRTLLEPGLQWLVERTGLPVFGVLPYFSDLRIPEEDAVAERLCQTGPVPKGDLRVEILRFPTISNFTDFDPLHREPGVGVRYLTEPPAEGGPLPDLLILPGSKSTAADLAWMRRQGLDSYVSRCRDRGVEVLGICGGFQMLGTLLYDPAHVESQTPAVPGLGLLPTSTLFLPTKVTAQVKGIHLESGQPVSGYELHAGRIQGLRRGRAVFKLLERAGAAVEELEGCRLPDQPVWGTFLHGLFEAEGFRTYYLNQLRRKTGKALPPPGPPMADPYDRLADEVQRHLDMKQLERWIPSTVSV